MKSELEFIRSIDCCFPYLDQEKASQLIREGSGISPNAAFYVLYELCHLPNNVSVSYEVLDALMSELQAAFHHPLSKMVFDFARKSAQGVTVSFTEVKNALHECRDFPGQYSAVNIVTLGAPIEDADQADEIAQQVIASWR